jgi:glycosyltransferase involved in cell wall biosynthesis
MASGPRTIEQIEERGLILLFQAFEILARRRSTAKLHIFGRWKEGAPAIERIKSRYTVPNVFLHHEYEPELPSWVARSSGVIIPYVSNRIGDVPMSALESMACGRPAIATTGIGLDEFLADNIAGILIQPDAASLANAVEQIMQNPDTWKSGALSTVKGLDSKTFGEHMCHHYQTLL